MIFITAGMGGGTGTGAAPVIAKAARDRGILTVGIVTLPFRNEGPKRVNQAGLGLEELRKNVDSLVVIHNDNIAKIYGTLPLKEAFGKADDILATAAKGIAELITRESFVNVDFADVRTVLTDSGLAIMGSGRASGPDKIIEATEAALASPLLNHQEIKGARNFLVNLSYGKNEIRFDETQAMLDTIQRKASRTISDPHAADIIWGAGLNPALDDDDVEVTIVATGFDNLNPLTPKQTPKAAAEPRIAQNSIFAATTGRKPQTSGVIRIQKKERFGDIAKFLETPAYIRRNIRLQNIAATGRTTKVSMKDDEPQPAPTPSDEHDLFGKEQQ